jgi:hypothetical protein
VRAGGPGPGPAAISTRRTRAGMAAAVASAKGPPPETPSTANSSTPNPLASSPTSRATDTKPGGVVVDLPYPGRETARSRTLLRRAASSSSATDPAVPGVPCRCTTGCPPGSPTSTYSTSRPSAVRNTSMSRRYCRQPPAQHQKVPGDGVAACGLVGPGQTPPHRASLWAWSRTGLMEH